MSDLTREEINTHLAYLNGQIDALKEQRSKFQGMLNRFPGEDHEVGTTYDSETGRTKVLCKTCGFETPWLREDPQMTRTYGSPYYVHAIYEHKRDPSMPWSEDGSLVDDQ